MRQLALDQVSRSYGPVQALRGVSLELRAGEVHALMGENGAGKSTLIRLLSGLERPDAGTLRLDGAAVRFDGAQAAQAAGLRVLHQELHVVPGLSVAENMHLHLALPTRAGLVRWGRLREAAAAALGRLGLGHIDPAAPMARLGPGDRMLTRIAATLIPAPGRPPWLYVFDEPTAALAGPEAERLFAVIAELRARGAGIVYVSHRMAEVMRLSDRISVLRDGRHVATLARGAATEPALIAAMTGREVGDLFPARPAAPEAAPPLLSVADLVVAGRLGPIDLQVAPGEILGLAGLAGSGRGALLAALVGALPRRAGRITLGGRDLPAAGPAAAWAAGVAYVPRERRAEGLMLDRPIAENVTLPHLGRLARLGALIDRRREARVTVALGAEVRLRAPGPQTPPGRLSGGNQQKVMFARAMAGRPRLMLLDEPTRGVDVGARADIYRLVRDLAAGGTAVILASSDLPELIGLSDRIAILHAGRIAATLRNAGLDEAGLLAQLYAAGGRAA